MSNTNNVKLEPFRFICHEPGCKNKEIINDIPYVNGVKLILPSGRKIPFDSRELALKYIKDHNLSL